MLIVRKVVALSVFATLEPVPADGTFRHVALVADGTPRARHNGSFLAPAPRLGIPRQAPTSPDMRSARDGRGHGTSLAASGAYHHIVYTADSAVFSALLRSMQSLSLHLAAPDRCVIHLIVPRADLQQASTLARCFQQSLRQGTSQVVPQVLIHEVRPMTFKADYRDRPDLQQHAAAFARLFIPEYLPNVSRVVYLDTDTLVRGDLTPLLEMHLNQPLAAVEEGTSFAQLWGKWFADLAKLVPNPGQSIFNDGVLVLDLERWRTENVTGELEDWALKAGASVDDQLLLNLEFQLRKSFDRLPHEWNDFRVRPTGWPDFGWSDELSPEHELSHAKIIHWTGPKPWDMSHKQQWIEQYRHLWELPGDNASIHCG